MIRIILALIGVAFCILSSFTAPAHAAPVLVPGDTALSGSLPSGSVGDHQGPAVTPATYITGIGLANHPDHCSSAYGSSRPPEQNN